jgi:hypothetical protein
MLMIEEQCDLAPVGESQDERQEAGGDDHDPRDEAHPSRIGERRKAVRVCQERARVCEHAEPHQMPKKAKGEAKPRTRLMGRPTQ